MYYLMNKNNPVAAFSVDTPTGLAPNLSLELSETFDKLPIGFQDINTWLENRKSSKHNAHLDKIMTRMGCKDNAVFLKLTHAASINDTFWVKSEKESITWEQISLYQNQFNDNISELSFNGSGIPDTDLSYISPELACEGSFRKCFRKENTLGQYGSDIYIYKRGGELGSGYEPYCEILSSEIANIISPDNSVWYTLSDLHGKTASRCNLFTNENYGYASFFAVNGTSYNNAQKMLEYFESIGSEQQFREMLVIDSLCFNQDRHSGNYGVLFDNDTLEIVSMAPVFDMNISLFPDASLEKFQNIGDVIYKTQPKLGDDFTRMGQTAMNDVIKDRVKVLKDFTFSFRGNDVFPPERVKYLEEVIQRQAAAILSKETLYTKDVFFSPQAAKDEERQKKLDYAKNLLYGFYDTVEDKFSDETELSICDDDEAIICIENDKYAIDVDFLNDDISLRRNMESISVEELAKENDPFLGTYKMLENELQKYTKSKDIQMFSQYLDKTNMTTVNGTTFLKDGENNDSPAEEINSASYYDTQPKS